MPNRLKDELIAIVSDYWASNQRPILLSLLGERLSSDAAAEKQAIGKTLRAFVKDEAEQELRIVHVEAHGAGVVPSGETQGHSDADLASRVPSPRIYDEIPAGKSSHIVQKDLWLLFRYGLQEGRRAFVEIPDIGPVSVKQLRESDQPEDGWIAVLDSDFPLRDVDGKASPFAAGEAIRNWATKNGVDLNRIQTARTEFVVKSAAKDTVTKNPSSFAMLASGLAMLEPHEQARIMIPADILVNLFRRT